MNMLLDVVVNDIGYQHIHRYNNQYLCFNCIFRLTPKEIDFKMLIYPFKE